MTAPKTVVSKYFSKLVKLPSKHRRFLRACESLKRDYYLNNNLVKQFSERLFSGVQSRRFENFDNVQKGIEAFILNAEADWYGMESERQVLEADLTASEAYFRSDFLSLNEDLYGVDLLSSYLDVSDAAANNRRILDFQNERRHEVASLSRRKRREIDGFLKWTKTKQFQTLISDYGWLKNRKMDKRKSESRRLIAELNYG